MTVGHFYCGIGIEIDGCYMRRPRFTPMSSIMAIFWLNPDQRTVRQGVICLTEIFVLRIWTVFITSMVRLSRLRAQVGRKWTNLFIFLPVILHELWIHERDIKK